MSGHRHSAGEFHVGRQQNAQRRPVDPDIGGLLQRRVMKCQHPVRGNQQERRRRVILEPHPPRPLQPCGALGDATILRHLQKVRLERLQAVQIRLDSADIGLVLGGEGQARRGLRVRRERAGARWRRSAGCGGGSCERMWRVRPPFANAGSRYRGKRLTPPRPAALLPKAPETVPLAGWGRTTRSPA